MTKLTKALYAADFLMNRYYIAKALKGEQLSPLATKVRALQTRWVARRYARTTGPSLDELFADSSR